MQARQRQLNRETGMEGLHQLGIGIGVNTGTVIAGTIGGGGRLEYTVLGDAVNLAQRLQAEAGANEILATAATVQAAPGLPAEPIGSRQVKGRKEPVETFRIPIAAEAEDPRPL
jgi:class 3 adenylate cyclase